MKPFYEELKALREKKEIELDQIQGRTKIDRHFLEAIEEGNFGILPPTYIKLFLRAYVIEIGGDPVEALAQLDHFLNQKPVAVKKAEQTEPDETDEEMDSHGSEKIDSNIFSFTNKTLRSKIVQGILLLILWFFIIYIIKQISNDDNGVSEKTRINPTEQIIGSIVSEETISTDFVVLSSREEVIDSEAPFSVKIVTTEALGYRVTSDTAAVENVFLPSGDQKTYRFIERLNLLLNQSTGVNIFINGRAIPRMNLQNEPVRVNFSTEPLRVSIKHYTRLG